MFPLLTTWFVLFAALLISLWLQRRSDWTERVFCIRYALLMALFLVLFPFLGPSAAPDSLANLFMLGPGGIGLTCYFACMTAWTAVFTARLTWVSVRVRQLADTPDTSPDDVIPRQLVSGWWLAMPLCIAAPTIVCLLVLVDPKDQRFMAMISAVIGVALALAPLLVAWLAQLRRAKTGKEPSEAESLVRGFRPYKDMPLKLWLLHRRAGVFFGITLIVYLGCGYVTAPGLFFYAPAFPTLGYVFILAMMATWLLGFLSFIFDPGRIPGIGIAIGIILVIQWLLPSTHTFERLEPNDPGPIPTAVETFRARTSPDQPAIVIGCSGGGITASVWTATVLEGLHRELPDFGDRVAAVSSVSGGGIGAMLYVDAFAESASPTADQMQTIVSKSGVSTLPAIGWGLAYPDLLRPVLGGMLRDIDRGWAQEQVWHRLLVQGDTIPAPGARQRSIGDWREGVRDGWRPIGVFNSTMRETGERLLISPVSFTHGDDPVQMRIDSIDYLDGGDISLATAARLSATFPYVSPLAQPELMPDAHHGADGGYFDNSGLVTLIELIDDSLSTLPIPERPRRIAIIEIRAAPPAASIAESRPPSKSGSLIGSAIGPIETLYNARTSTQISRTDLELGLARQAWRSRFDVAAEHFVFHLTGDLPLSWHLTRNEKQRIRDHWPRDAGESDDLAAAGRDANESELERLRLFLRGEEPGMRRRWDQFKRPEPRLRPLP